MKTLSKKISLTSLQPNINIRIMIPRLRFIAAGSKIMRKEDERLIVSILGPTNAGKSTLFNQFMDTKANKTYRLACEKFPKRKKKKSKRQIGYSFFPNFASGAIVSKYPGTTRDCRVCIGRIGTTTFDIIDTAGIDGKIIQSQKSPKDNKSINRLIIDQSLEAAKRSDLILLIFDGKIGETRDLIETIGCLRKIGSQSIFTYKRRSDLSVNPYHYMKYVIILANKLEGKSWVHDYDGQSHIYQNITQISRCGFGDAIPISAEHNEGLADIAVIIEELTTEKRKRMKISRHEIDGEPKVTGNIFSEEETKPLQLAIVGRQNVGKSLLVNSLLNKNRVISGSKPGLTRDAIYINWEWQGKPVQIIDTAGIRRMVKRDNSNPIENFSIRDTMRAMKVADVTVLVLDAESLMVQRQELAFAESILREGRALVIVANKMDLVVDVEYTKQNYESDVKKQIEYRFPMLEQTPLIAMSSLTGDFVDYLMPAVFTVRDLWSQFINTGLLNKWLTDILLQKPPPPQNGRMLKIKYIVQKKSRPPTFILFCNMSYIQIRYMRYLMRELQRNFKMFGMKIRMLVKKSSTDHFSQEK